MVNVRVTGSHYREILNQQSPIQTRLANKKKVHVTETEGRKYIIQNAYISKLIVSLYVCFVVGLLFFNNNGGVEISVSQLIK